MDNDLILLNKTDIDTYLELSRKKYSNNTMGNDGKKIKVLRSKLKNILSHLQNKYNSSYGPFILAGSSGNPLSRSGSVNIPWAALCKGSEKKQYAAQIGISFSKDNRCINVGFSFGRASSHTLDDTERLKHENNLIKIAQTIIKNIEQNEEVKIRYNILEDLGFHYYYNDEIVSGAKWLQYASAEPNKCKITAHIFTDDYNAIELSTIDTYIAQIIFLIKCIDGNCRILPPLTPKQWARRAEEMTIIGYEGELIALEYEKERIKELGYDISLVKHVSMISDSFGYDILSKDEDTNDLYIEVKSTTRLPTDPMASEFHISNNEYQFYLNNKNRYRLYRVFGVRTENPSIIAINMDSITILPKDYIVKRK